MFFTLSKCLCVRMAQQLIPKGLCFSQNESMLGEALHNTEPKARGFELCLRRKQFCFDQFYILPFPTLTYLWILLYGQQNKQQRSKCRGRINLQIMMSGQIQGQMIHRNQKHAPLLQIKKSHIGISLMLSNCFSFYISSVKDLQSFF